jgi:hypothetical protein
MLKLTVTCFRATSNGERQSVFVVLTELAARLEVMQLASNYQFLPTQCTSTPDMPQK